MPSDRCKEDGTSASTSPEAEREKASTAPTVNPSPSSESVPPSTPSGQSVAVTSSPEPSQPWETAHQKFTWSNRGAWISQDQLFLLIIWSALGSFAALLVLRHDQQNYRVPEHVRFCCGLGPCSYIPLLQLFLLARCQGVRSGEVLFWGRPLPPPNPVFVNTAASYREG